MAQFPVQPPTAPVAFESGSGYGESNPKPKAPALTQAEKSPDPKKPQPPAHPKDDGRRNPDSGGLTYGHSAGALMASIDRILQNKVSRENPNTCPRQIPEEGAVPRQDATKNAAPPQDPARNAAPRQG